MFRWTIFLCLGLYLSLQIGGEDRGQKRIGLVQAEQDAAEEAAAVAAAAQRLAAARQSADGDGGNEVLSLSAVNPDAAIVNVAFAPNPVLMSEAGPQALAAAEPAAPAGVAPGDVLTRLMYVAGRSVNVRGGPSTRNPVVGKLGRGDAVSVVWVEANGWARIRVEGDGVDGYMSLDFLRDAPPRELTGRVFASAAFAPMEGQKTAGSAMARTVLITGCSSGIGLDAARGLKARGWRVFATCRKESDCATLREEGLESFPLDYADEASIAAAVEECLSRSGGTLDALFNNGAFACPGAVEDLPRAALREIYETNLFGYHDLTRRVIPAMRAQGHGRIVNCSSVLGLVALKWRGAYVSTKFAMEGLTDVLRIEMRGTGIEVVLIEPGPITSRIRQNAIPHFEKWIDWENSARAEEYRSLRARLYEERGPDRFELPASAVTKALIHALESGRPKPRYYVTTPTHLMGLARRILPTRALDWLIAKG